MALIIFACFVLLLRCSPIGADNEVAALRQLAEAYPDWQPRAILDVGANIGGWSRQARKIYRNTKILMVEAFPQHNTTLTKVAEEIGNASHRIAVLSERDGDVVKFYKSKKGFTTGNSMFKENTKFYEDAEFTEHITSTLDTLVAQAESSFSELDYDYLKLDVQGAELVVLKGADKILRKVTFVQFEASLIQYNEGGACLWQVDEILRQYGFYLYDLADFNKRSDLFLTKGMGQMDVLYVRPSSDALPSWLKENKVNMCGSSANNSSKTLHLESSANIERTLDRDNFPSPFEEIGASSIISGAMFVFGVFIGLLLPSRRFGRTSNVLPSSPIVMNGRRK